MSLYYACAVCGKRNATADNRNARLDVMCCPGDCRRKRKTEMQRKRRFERRQARVRTTVERLIDHRAKEERRLAKLSQRQAQIKARWEKAKQRGRAKCKK